VRQGFRVIDSDTHVNPSMTKAVIELMGDELMGDRALMFASDYPHPETIFPDHVDAVIAWRRELGEQVTQRLMWENAARFLRLGSTPWGDPPRP
jgi:predicted TIM-barrel fold metal-dependent hydrolase